MADETPDTTEEPQVTPAETAEAPSAPQAEAAPEAPAAEPVTPLTPKERKVASRARRGNRRGATPEERAETRKAKAAARTRYRTKRREKDRAAKAEAGTAGPAQSPPSKEHGPGAPKERLGIVVSDKADKTITVRIDTARRHRRYQKIVRSSATLHAHDEANDANAGDRVRVIESRPLSATKRWRLVEILERAK
jgi:small subunit ribosomal protein S17